MSKSLKTAGIQRHDELMLLLPRKMKYDDAIELIAQAKVADEEITVVSESIPCYPWDGAIALAKAMTELFGIVLQTATPSIFGDKPPALVSIATGPDTEVKVPWGRFTLPGVKPGFIETGWNGREGTFTLTGQVRRYDADTVQALFDRTRAIASKESIYRGKALSIRFCDDDGEQLPMPKPSFLRLSDTLPIFSKSLERAIETNIYTPIRHSRATKAAGIPLKRGVLFAGPYGTGKTMLAGAIARTATQNGWTFIYVPKIDELSYAIDFAMRFQPCVVMSEDVDRVAGMERTNEVNDLLNTLDGIGNKAADIMTILTSNHASNINPALRRPGRIDVTLEVSPPDAEAVTRLIHFYGAGRIRKGESVDNAGRILAGQIPAVIRETLERAKLEALRRSGGTSTELYGIDIVAAATTLLAERGLFQPTKQPDAVERLGDALGKRIGSLLRLTAASIDGTSDDYIANYAVMTECGAQRNNTAADAVESVE